MSDDELAALRDRLNRMLAQIAADTVRVAAATDDEASVMLERLTADSLRAAELHRQLRAGQSGGDDEPA